MSDVRVEAATMDDLEAVVECWVALARGQRDHGSHILPEENRDGIREAVGQHVLAGDLLVAREVDVADANDGPGTEDDPSVTDDAPDADDADGTDAPDAADGGIVGFVMFGLEADSLARDLTRGIVHNVYVRPEARDRGVGSRLLAAAESRLADAGADAVALEVMADNDDARRLYRRRGYEPHRVELEKAVESDTSTTSRR